MLKYELNIAEISITFLIAIVTIISQPPLPILAIPFIMIITMRTIFSLLEKKI